MEYHGKLYGKIGNKYFDTGKTSKDFDDMCKLLKEALTHVDSTFYPEIRTEIEQLLTKITQ